MSDLKAQTLVNLMHSTLVYIDLVYLRIITIWRSPQTSYLSVSTLSCLVFFRQNILNPLKLAFVASTGLDFPVNTCAYTDVCGDARGALGMYCSVTVVDGFGDLRPWALYGGVTSVTRGFYYDLPKLVP